MGESQEINQMRIRLLEQCRDGYVKDYADKAKTFTDLDTKSQSTAAIAGIFLAAALAFLTGENLNNLFRIGGRYALFLLGCSIALLAATAVFCVLAMRIRVVAAPVESDTFSELVRDFLKMDPSEISEVAVENFLRDQIAAWTAVAGDALKANNDKAGWVQMGQWLLTAAILLVTALLLVILAMVWRYTAA